MQRIRNKLRYTDDLIPTIYWDVTKSGKVIELRVKPCMETDPGCYRLGIIQIGRIISRISSMTTKEGSGPRIHLFPNLSERQLAATIHWPEFLQALPTKFDAPESVILSEKMLQKITLHHNLSLVPALNLEDTGASGDQRTYTVVSHSNQPFAWLKVGQFIQELSEFSSYSLQDMNLTFEILPAALPEGASSQRKNSYEQLQMSINTVRKNVD